jgi:hypothetical protein
MNNKNEKPSLVFLVGMVKDLPRYNQLADMPILIISIWINV